MTTTFAEHKDRVNSVKWLSRDNEAEFEFLSGSDDSQCIYWNLKDLNNPEKVFLKGHSKGVTSVDTIWISGEIFAVTASADSTIKLWKWRPDDVRDGKSIESFQTINLQSSGICFKVKFCIISGGLLLAATLDDDKIHFYSENSQVFTRIESLLGHEDWVRDLDFTTDGNGDTLLASSSQDSFIRIWRISSKAESILPAGEDLIQVEERTFKIGETTQILILESVLQGHENWVYSVHWNRTAEGKLQLLSSSMDKTMIIWSLDVEQEIWTEKIRVGDVGGNSLGYYGAKFHGSGKSIIGHGFLGSLHLWHENKDNSKLWQPGLINGGHFKEVRDIGWEPQGKFLFSVSIDQTTRIHGCWKDDKEPKRFFEIARPQVHGYDMQCIAVLSRYKFASAAEEKIVRTFQAPGNFVENFKNLICSDTDVEGDKIVKSQQKGAAVPSLGLSNKAVYEEDLLNPQVDDKKFKDEYPENYFVPITMKEPPTEEYLVQNTLWPELQKLYAHGYELYSLAATRDGKILASACKSTTIEHSEIILWDVNSWKILQRLQSHKLTVTQMKFSHKGDRLLSVSRDRKWTVFEKKVETEGFKIEAASDKQNGVHERIIWCCDWSHDDKFFVTGSREGKVCTWVRSETGSGYKNAATLYLPQDSITALSFASKNLDTKEYLLAVGLESGCIHLYNFSGLSFTILKTLNHSEAHHLSVNKLEFHPESFLLASCANDNIVKIYDVKL